MKLLHASDFAQVPDAAYGRAFGIDHKRGAANLRELADTLEAGDLCLADVRVETHTQNDDWASTTLVLKFHERVKPKAP